MTPMIKANEVIRIGRKRWAAACFAASIDSRLPRLAHQRTCRGARPGEGLTATCSATLPLVTRMFLLGPLEYFVQQRFCLEGRVMASRYGVACSAASSISAAASLGC